MSSSWFDTFPITCHPAWRAPRQTARRIILLPDGNARKGEAGRDYAAGAKAVVACAEHLARRGDIEALLVCVLSRLNAEKRPEAFFQALTNQFEKLRGAIADEGFLVREGIRCEARGDLRWMREAGGARASLAAAIEGACRETRHLPQTRLTLEFWVAYPDDLAFERDADLLVRTGAEDPNVVRPGLWLPEDVPCVATTTLWPDATPALIDALVEEGFSGRLPHFAPGYDLGLVAALLRALPASRIPAPMRISLPVCASPDDIRAMLDDVYADPLREPAVALSWLPAEGAEPRLYGPRDEAWYALRLVPASAWPRLAAEPCHAIVAPGQTATRLKLAMPAGAAHAHACAPNAEGLLEALRKAARFPVEHVLLHGADRAEAHSSAAPPPWSRELLSFLEETRREPERSIESIVRERLPPGENEGAEQRLLVEAISARALGRALAEGLLLPDEPLRIGDRNYAYTGACMMLRVPDESNPTGSSWEPAAELAIRCMLAVSVGDNGVFDRVLPGESAEAWRARLDSGARYLDAAARGDTTIEPPAGRGHRAAQAIGEQWRQIFAAYPRASAGLVLACRDALVRHYRANVRERAPDAVDKPLVRRLGLGGAPRREAIRAISTRYAAVAPEPVGERIRALLRADSSDPRRFEEQKRELRLLMHLVDTAHSIAVEVLFTISALPTPAAFVTDSRLQALIEVGRAADYAFRLANDLASLGAYGEDRDSNKESSLSILVPRGLSSPRRATAREEAMALGSKTLEWLQGHLRASIARLAEDWPSMAEKIERAVAVGAGVYTLGHYTTLGAREMLELVETILRERQAPSSATVRHEVASFRDKPSGPDFASPSRGALRSSAG